MSMINKCKVTNTSGKTNVRRKIKYNEEVFKVNPIRILDLNSPVDLYEYLLQKDKVNINRID